MNNTERSIGAFDGFVKSTQRSTSTQEGEKYDCTAFGGLLVSERPPTLAQTKPNLRLRPGGIKVRITSVRSLTQSWSLHWLVDAFQLP